MSLREPANGEVIRYAFLWKSEAEAGVEEAAKDRPCAVVMSTRRKDGELQVVVLPITHSPPDNPSVAIEIPPDVCTSIGLDGEQQWIRVDELNTFLWPGYDLRPIPGKKGGYSYGMLPPGLFSNIQRKVREIRKDRKLKASSRD